MCGALAIPLLGLGVGAAVAGSAMRNQQKTTNNAVQQMQSATSSVQSTIEPIPVNESTDMISEPEETVQSFRDTQREKLLKSGAVGTTLTSPLGTTSKANIGKKTLLGG